MSDPAPQESFKLDAPDNDETARRMTIGPLAYQCAKDVAGDDRVTRDHLEAAIRKLREHAQLGERLEPLIASLAELHVDNVHMRYMLLSLAARDGEEAIKTIEKGNMWADAQLAKLAKAAPEVGEKALDMLTTIKRKRTSLTEQNLQVMDNAQRPEREI